MRIAMKVAVVGVVGVAGVVSIGQGIASGAIWIPVMKVLGEERTVKLVIRLGLA